MLITERKKELFHSHLDKTGGCWIWRGALSKWGYGKFSLVTGSHSLAHRVSYEIYNGDIPKGLCVLHKCDVPACVNPKHLFIGTNKDNTDDAMRKGRNVKKLSPEKVREIRMMFLSSTQDEIAELYGVSQSCISAVRVGSTWGHVK